MARKKAEKASGEDPVSRQVSRMILNMILLGGSLALLGAWVFFGHYQLEPGQSAVILRFGEYSRTVSEPGLKLHLPPPIESHDIVKVSAIEREEFGARASQTDEEAERMAWASFMQTGDNAIVQLDFEVQYRIKDAFRSRYRIASPRDTLRDAAQAAMREVVGRTSIDGVLSDQRGQVGEEAQQILQETMDRYESGLQIYNVNLLDVQPPQAVRGAFDDVIAASQDRSRTINEAEGYANEVVPQARGEASELLEAAQGYRDAKIAESTGEGARFSALVVEYQKAPEVTRKRLYLETMELILPSVEKVIVESGSNVLPYLPIGRVPTGVSK